MLPIVSFLTRGKSSSCRPPVHQQADVFDFRVRWDLRISWLPKRLVTGIVHGVGFTTWHLLDLVRWFSTLHLLDEMPRLLNSRVYGRNVCLVSIFESAVLGGILLRGNRTTARWMALAFKSTSLINLMTKLWDASGRPWCILRLSHRSSVCSLWIFMTPFICPNQSNIVGSTRHYISTPHYVLITSSLRLVLYHCYPHSCWWDTIHPGSFLNKCWYKSLFNHQNHNERTIYLLAPSALLFMKSEASTSRSPVMHWLPCSLMSRRLGLRFGQGFLEHEMGVKWW